MFFGTLKNPQLPEQIGVFFISPLLKDKEVQMKTIQEKLCSIVTDLDVICETLSSLIKEVGIAASPSMVDHYFKFLLAFERIKETIKILEGIIKETENVTSTT
jgi:hypothetical protein